MFGLIRRISHSVIPRPDRPWADDPTSNAPAVGKKRRMSSTEREQELDTEESSKKKLRGESTASSLPDTNEAGQPQVESRDVKEVIEGVNEVELTDSETYVAPEAIPLPEEESGELDEPASGASPSPGAQSDDNASSVDDGSSDSPINGTPDLSSDTAVETEETIAVRKEDDAVPVPASTVPKVKKTAPTETIQDISPSTA